MAYNKLYTKTTWNNDNRPAINADNLNHIEKGIDDIDSRVVEIGNDVSDVKSGLTDLASGEYGSKNIFNPQSTYNGWYAIDDSGTIGKGTSSVTKTFEKVAYVKKGTTYTISMKTNSPSSSSDRISFVTSNDVKATTKITTKINGSSTFTATEDGYLYIGCDVNTSANDVMVEIGNVATEYVPYVGQSVAQLNNSLHDIEFLGWETPSACPIQNSYTETTANIKVGRVDLGSLNWVRDSGGTFYVTIPKANTNNLYVEGFTVLDTNYQFNKYSTYSNKTIGSNSNNYIYVKYTDSADVTAFKNAIKGQYLYFELATPTTKTIDGNEAVSQLKADLSWKNIYKQPINSTGTNYTYTGLSFTLDKKCDIYLVFGYSNTYCTGFAITSNTSGVSASNLWINYDQVNSDLPLYRTPTFSLEAGTYYLYAKHKIAGKTTENVNVFYR